MRSNCTRRKSNTREHTQVPESVVKLLEPHAVQFLKTNDIALGDDDDDDDDDNKKRIVTMVAKCLAGLTGHYKATDLAGRSLLSSESNYTTFAFRSRSNFTHAGYVWTPLRRDFDENVKESIRGLRLTKDGHGAVFDVRSVSVRARRQF